MNGRVLAIARKEFRHIFRDPGSLGAILVLPLFLLVMFGYAVSLDVDSVPLAVRDLDRSPESRALTEAFFSGSLFVPAGAPDDAEAEARLLRSGAAAAVLEIPPGFGRELGRDETAPVQILVDGSDGTRAMAVVGYLDGVCVRFGNGLKSLRLLASGGEASTAAAAIASRGVQSAGAGDSGVPAPAATVRQTGSAAGAVGLDLRPRVLFNQELRSVVFLVPGLVALILVITAVVSTALSVVREKENGSMEQLLVSPVGAVELILGKTLPYGAVGAVAATIVIAAAAALFGVEVRGGIFALAWTTGLFLLASLALGVLISTIADTQQVAFLISTMVTLIPTFTLSGFVFPIRNMPKIIQILTRILPTTYYLEILRAVVIKGAPFRYYWHQAGALALYAAIAVAVASARFARSRS